MEWLCATFEISQRIYYFKLFDELAYGTTSKVSMRWITVIP